MELDALTPPLKKVFAGDEERAEKLDRIARAHPSRLINYIVDDARAENVVLHEKNVVIIVGHEPRLGTALHAAHVSQNRPTWQRRSDLRRRFLG